MGFKNEDNTSEAQVRRQQSSASLMALKSKRANQNRIIQARLDRSANPLSFAQQRLWFLNELIPDIPLYNVPAPVSIRGHLDLHLLNLSLNEIVRRHDILRTSFLRQDSDPVQLVASSIDLSLEVIDLSSLPEADRQRQARQIAQAEAREVFDLTRGPLLRATLLRLGEQEHWLLLTMHHIITDAWSVGIILRELTVIYEALAAHKAPPLRELAIQYGDFAHWQRNWMQGQVLDEQLSYWKRQLDSIQPLQLPSDKPRPATRTFVGQRQLFLIPEVVAAQLDALSRREGVTLYMTLLAAFSLLLSRYSNQLDIALGSPIANRNRGEIEDLVGFFVNTLVIRTDLSGNPTFSQLLRRVREVTLAAFAHQDLPFEKLVEELHPQRDLSQTPLFQAVFAMQNFPLPSLSAAGLSFAPVELDTATAKFDITLFVMPVEGGGLRASLEYSSELFDHSTIVRMLTHLQNLLVSIATDPDRSICSLPMLTQQEEQTILPDWNSTARDSPHNLCVHELFEEQVELNPSSVAIVYQGEHLSYEQLNRKANQLAHYLRSKGVGAEVLVGLCVERSMEMVVGLLGILKAGGAYLPLDPSYPPDRLQFMLRDSKARVLVTQKHLHQQSSDGEVRVVCLDEDRTKIEASSEENPSKESLPDNLAYVIYTSGSTGTPKGVGVTHANVTRLFTSTERWFAFGSSDVWTFFHSYAFDFSVWEIWGALLYGGQVVVIPYFVSRSPEAFYNLVAEQKVTVLNQTPTAFRQFMDVDEDQRQARGLSLRLVIFGGEALDLSSLNKWFARHSDRSPELVNMYGITETTVHVTYRPIRTADVEAATGSVIGIPIPDLWTYVLDASQNPVPIGVAGEIYVGGRGLARGYLHQPGLTAERFFPCPFTSQPGSRMYRTGDLARWLPNGDLQYLGRVDTQIKLRGFRIELGEIEARLLEHATVREAIVTLREDTPGDPRLTAYVTPTQAEPLSVEQLRGDLRQKLPSYMIPSAFVVMDAFPLTPSGKLDRRALPSPDQPPQLTNDFAPPTSDLEHLIAGIWNRVLGREGVGLHDNFFDMGGHSLLLIRVQGELNKELRRPIQIVDLFRYPTVASLAQYLDSFSSGEATETFSTTPETTLQEQSREMDSIAIIGMAGRFPGARNIDELWRNLTNGVESISHFTEQELFDAGVDEANLRDPNYVRAGGALEDADLFDADFFNMTPREAEITDPQQRIFMECAWEAMEDAGCASGARNALIGVFAGVSRSTYIFNLLANREFRHLATSLQAMISNEKDFIATRTSYKLNLKGPSVDVQTACSTSLVAVHMACQSLLNGECDVALAGGATITVPSKSGYFYQPDGAVSPDGHCRAFDEKARGTVPGNGVGVVALKRLSQAIIDRDPIHAVILGSAINNDGAVKVGFSAPSVQGQAEVIREAQRRAGVRPETIGYVEAHGTATALGDPIEVAALTQAFQSQTMQKSYCAIGSVKSNVGHLDAAAGVTGLIKAALCVKHGVIPPSLHFERSNPEIDFKNSPFYVNTKLRPWPGTGYVRRAGVSSFGLGGTNAHVVLQEPPPASGHAASRKHQLLVLSGKTRTALDAISYNLAEFLRSRPGVDLADVAYTLQTGREAFPFRRAFLCRTIEEAVALLQSSKDARVASSASGKGEGRVAFMFPGQAVLWPNTGQRLYAEEPEFARAIDECAERLAPFISRDLRDILFPDPENIKALRRDLKKLVFTQSALFAFEFALARMWMSWGIRPQVMLGYSLGEYVAACLAGVFSLEDALGLVATRGHLLDTLPPGSMLAVPLGEHDVVKMLDHEVSLAAVNGPSDSVLSGSQDCMTRIAAELAADAVECRALSVTRAGHSSMLNPILADFAHYVERISLSPPRIPYLSNLTGGWIRADEATSPQYWVRHLRETVRFSDGLDKLLQDRSLILLEVGPGNGLVSLSRMHPGYSGQTLLASMKMNSAQEGSYEDVESEIASVVSTLGRLWQDGAAVDWSAFHKSRPRRKLNLPTYAFERESYWVERDDTSAQLSDAVAGRAELSDWFHIPTWKRVAQTGFRPSTVDGTQQHWLIFVDESGIGREVGRRLQEAGHAVTFVRRSDSFSRLSDEEFTISQSDHGDTERLLDALPVLPDHVVHCWNISTSSIFEVQHSDPFDRFRQAQELGLLSILSLASALEHRIATRVEFTVISNGLHSVIGTEHIYPEKATALGPICAPPGHNSNTIFRNIDLDDGADTDSALEELLVELLRPTPFRVIAYRGRHRWIPSFERAVTETPLRTSCRPNGVYMIVGRLTDFALRIAEYLARTSRGTIIIAEPLEWPARSQWEAVASDSDAPSELRLRVQHALAMEQFGAQVVCFQADVSCEARLREIVCETGEQFKCLNGVIFIPTVERATDLQPSDALWLAAREYSALNEALRYVELDFCIALAGPSSEQEGADRVLLASINSMLGVMVEQGWSAGGKRVLLAEIQTDPEGQREFLLNGNCVNQVIERLLSDSSASHVVISPVGIDRQGIVERAAVKPSRLRRQKSLNRTNGSHPERAVALPSNEIEAALVRVWAELLGIPDISIHDNFFDLGGNSLIAIHLMARIRRDFGRQIPVSALFQYGTVERLAMRLRHPECVPGESPLVPIKHCNCGVPIFCVHALGGDVLCFEPLARHLGEDRPFYALQAPGLLDLAEADDFPTIEARAAHYLRFIREVQPEGPYYFSGYCFGGAVAFEMSRQISKLGQRVALLTLFDSIAPGVDTELSDTALILSAIREIARQSGRDLSFDPGTFDTMESEKRIEQLLRVLRQNRLVPPNVDPQLAMNWVRSYLRGQRARLNSLTQYRPRGKYSGPVVLFRATDTWANADQDSSLGWEHLCAGPFNAYPVPGDHTTMLRDPAAEILAANLRRCLEETDSWFVPEEMVLP